MVGDDGAQRCFQARDVHRLARREHEGLGEVMRFDELLLEEVELDGRQEGGAEHRALFNLWPTLLLRHARQRFQCLVLEELVGGQMQAGLTRARDDLDGEDGVSAQLEEVVAQADARHAQQLGPDGGQRLLTRRLGFDEISRVARLQLRSRQRAPVDLAVGREGQCRQ